MAALTGWFGGKNSMSNWIYSHIPKDIKNYIEIFIDANLKKIEKRKESMFCRSILRK